jgi:hypothetical protein
MGEREVEAEICRICRTTSGALSYEHVPPRSSFNDERVTVHGMENWLAREDGEPWPGGRIEQRGAGDRTLCERCNNNTGSWYGNELALATRAAARLLREAPLAKFDASTEPGYAQIRIKQTPTSPHPLRFIKQVVTMILATSPPELPLNHPELGDFVADRERTGLLDRFQFYLTLFAGPIARSTGVVTRYDGTRERFDTFVEVAFPPFAYVMAIGSEPDAIETCNITGFVDVGYNARADLELDLLIGFGHTPVPADYRTQAMLDEQRRASES